MSDVVLRALSALDGHAPHYEFLYKELRHIIHTKQSKGNTRVRFVSSALCTRDDPFFRHVSLEFIVPKEDQERTCDFYRSEKYSMTLSNEWRDEFAIALPNIPHSIDEIQALEANLPRLYLIGYMDCRHHVKSMLNILYED